MNSNHSLAVRIAERLLDALPSRHGATAERGFVAKAAIIISELLNDEGNQVESNQIKDEKNDMQPHTPPPWDNPQQDRKC